MAEIKEKDLVSVTEGDEMFQGVVVKVKEINCDIKFDGKDESETHRLENVTLVESWKDPKELSPEDQLAADRKALEKEKAELEEKRKALTEQQDQVATNLEKSITISETKIDYGKFNKADNPQALAKEVAKQEKLAATRKVNRLAKAKDAAESTPITVRKNILTSRLTTVRKKQHHRYTKEQVALWAEELTIIQQTPDAWSVGCVKPKKQPSALDRLDKLGD